MEFCILTAEKQLYPDRPLYVYFLILSTEDPAVCPADELSASLFLAGPAAGFRSMPFRKRLTMMCFEEVAI